MADGPVLLGLVEENMPENDDRICGWTTNKIGGTPNWLLGPPPHYPTCLLCNKMLYLVCQVYCPLSNSMFHRVLYVFGCINASCWNKNTSWKVLRSQAKDSNFGTKKATENESPSVFEVDDWCDDAEDWGDESEAALTSLEQCTGNLKLSETNSWEKDPEGVENSITQLRKKDHTTTQPQNVFTVCGIPHFTPFYISVIEAPDMRGSSAQLTKHEKKLLSEYQQREGVHVADLISNDENLKGWTGERYESVAGNRAFHKFNKTLQLCPQQCLRYQWNGTPVSMVTTNPSELSANIPPCQNCGSGRAFELQFMPALVSNLKYAKHSNTTHKLVSQTPEQNNKKEQFTEGINKLHLQTLENSSVEATGVIYTDGPTCQEEEQRKMSVASVNQIPDVTIEFGTVMVFTCSQSCWKDLESSGVYLEEFCLVETDPDDKLFH